MDVAASLNGALRRVPVWAVCGLGLVPLAVLVWRGLSGGLGIDPVKTLEHQLGLTALQLLLAGLVVTPLRRWTGVNLIRYRRAIGLLAFLYAALHLLVWLWLDLQLRWSEIGADLVKRPYVIVGMLGFACLVPLAMTSNGWSVRWLGAAAWQRLHRLAYAAVLLAALHYLLLVKVWSAEPLLYALAAAGLVALRWLWRRGRSGTVRA
ncbi:MAG: protein-methionine-sulfoxide reductase heme-binding subunit MsrQ [Rhodobacter sp.]|nr:protein-methionine-sulfoxide reductase heme-binding subunit MsrQ [Rhodobacter sp.]MCA3494604.1 protein-methionine-sulfoxide reductase heme-binding subunit MsrQ [Rhodobacter sp.]MCA3499600.1 protein-methionine-sulfoxide reductase heme-binding subunit MsrQ [Rhodobacter sp.]MCA3502820.1 protein-methionine-sulfoxide reductase heme-binding subunit MsrQ [Rhodobacter sp.]MCA3516596.1 protein-methionine-sulfoxide reductase heme-binding subunit MsrQ [Rhodobacter sp.]